MWPCLLAVISVFTGHYGVQFLPSMLRGLKHTPMLLSISYFLVFIFLLYYIPFHHFAGLQKRSPLDSGARTFGCLKGQIIINRTFQCPLDQASKVSPIDIPNL